MESSGGSCSAQVGSSVVSNTAPDRYGSAVNVLHHERQDATTSPSHTGQLHLNNTSHCQPDTTTLSESQLAAR
jgi:hypothetical protein